MNFRVAVIFSLQIFMFSSLYAGDLEDAIQKASESGGSSLSFKECKLVGSKYGSIDANGDPFPEGGFHCKYISKVTEANYLKKLQKKYKNFKGTLLDLCNELRGYNGYTFDKKLLTCKFSGVATASQKEYDTIAPFFKEQHFTILKQREKLIAQKKAKEKKAKTEIRSRKGNTHPIKSSIGYKCSSSILHINTLNLSKDFSSLNIETFIVYEPLNIVMDFEGDFENYKLYKGRDSGHHKYIAKVFTKKGINGGSVNFELKRSDQYASRFYCIKK